MNLRKALATGLLAATLATSIDAAPRRRAVSPGDPLRATLSHVLPDVAADEDVRYTNLGTAGDRIRVCVENTKNCIEDTLSPGASSTKNDLVRGFGLERANLEVFSTQPTEVRAHHDAIPITLATTSRQTIPVMDLNQALTIYAKSAGVADIELRGSNGVWENAKKVDLVAGTNRINLGFDNTAVGKQYDIIPSTPTIATTVVNGVQHRAKALTEATSEQYIVNADANSTLWVRNPDPTSILSLNTAYFKPNNENTVPTLINGFTALNGGTRFINQMANGIGSVQILGSNTGNGFQTLLAWSQNNVQSGGASANAGFGDTGLPKYNVSMNQIPADKKVRLTNASQFNGPVNYTVTGVNDAGTQTGTLNGTLLTYDNAEIDVASLNATRLIVSAQDAASGLSTLPNILLGTNINGVAKGGWQYEKPGVQEPQYNITAEIYVKDNGQVLMQKTNPSAAVMKKLLNLDNLLVYDDGLLSYTCESFPDPIVNSLPELIANYNTKLTQAEKQDFSGDEPGFRPYAANPCSDAPQNVYLVRVNFDRIN